MAYATRADMELKYGPAEVLQLTDTTEPRTGLVNDQVLQRALNDASDWIDGYLVGRYPVPISDVTVSGLLRMHCCVVARYNLMTHQADEAATKAFEATERYFMAISKGSINLLPPAAVPEPSGVGTVEFDYGTKHFGRERWRDC